MSSSIRAKALVALSLALAVGATACGGGSSEAEKDTSSASASPQATALPAALTSQKLTWKACPAPSAAQGGAGEAPGKLADGTAWECSTLKAPLDYAEPDGETIDVAMIRATARQDGYKRLGSLVFNFGGPGASGVAMLPNAAEEYEKLRRQYDLVSFDPRGVGNTSGVKCLDDKAMDRELQAEQPGLSEEAEEKLAVKKAKEFAAACQKNSGKILAHLSTTSTARDMDLMRQALGDDKLNYFGISYGTELGGVYAHLFPKNVGRTTLDAVVDPTSDSAQRLLSQAKGFQRAFENFMKNCRTKHGADCPTGGSTAEGNKEVAALLEQLRKEPVPTESGRKLTAELARTGIETALYNEDAWEALAGALQEVELEGSGDSLLMLADHYLGRDDKGRYDNSIAAQAAITCADSNQRFTLEEAKSKVAELKKASPVFGESMAAGLLSCSNWPVKGERKLPEVSAPGASPILVIGNEGDPATPVEGAKKMADKLGKGVGVNLTVKGEGHGTYGVNSCATKAVDGLLLDGKVPADGTVCS